jgi:hypothetical protein
MDGTSISAGVIKVASEERVERFAELGITSRYDAFPRTLTGHCLAKATK